MVVGRAEGGAGEGEAAAGTAEAEPGVAAEIKERFARYEELVRGQGGKVVPDPVKYGVAEGELRRVLGGSLATAMTLAVGIAGLGYKARVKRAEEGVGAETYSAVRAAGFELEETAAAIKQPELPIEIYEFQTCPFCKKVRNAVCMLGIDVTFRPCPKDGKRWRPEAIAKGGKSQFPYMVDQNTGTAMYESADIIAYLFKTYGPGEVPASFSWRNGVLLNGLGMIGAGGRGGKAKPSIIPEQPLVLWSYDASPFCALVKEALCELELPYKQLATPRGSERRQQLLDRKGTFQVPFLEDPNTGVEMFESKSIVAYLGHVYGDALAQA